MIYFDICSFWRIQISFWRLPIDGDECGEEVGEQHHSERVRRLYRAELPFQHLPRNSSALIDNTFSPKERTFCAFYTLHKQAKLCITLFDYMFSPKERTCAFYTLHKQAKLSITLFDYIPTERENFNIASGGAL